MSKFSVRSLFGVTAAVALLVALAIWINDAENIRSYDAIPPLFHPSISFMIWGFALVPFVCLPALLIILAITATNPPRPISLIVFVGLQFAGLTIADDYRMGLKWIFAMLFACILICAETYLRNLPRLYRYVCGLSLVMTFAWYIAMICVAASASV